MCVMDHRGYSHQFESLIMQKYNWRLELQYLERKGWVGSIPLSERGIKSFVENGQW